MSADMTQIPPAQSKEERIKKEEEEHEKEKVRKGNTLDESIHELRGLEIKITKERLKGTERNREKIAALQKEHHALTQKVSNLEVNSILDKNRKEKERREENQEFL